MVALNNEYFVQQFESPEEKSQLPQLSEVRLLGKFKYYNVNSPLFQDPYLYQGSAHQLEDITAYHLKNRHQRKQINDQVIKVLTQ
jgi:hypothetical protein